MDRYEEALEKARAGKSLEEIFPELKESEDERVRKWLIEEIKATHDYDSPTSKKCVDDALAYLEKRKESTWTEEDERFRTHILPRILNQNGWTMEQIEADRKRLKEFVERQKNKWLEKKEEQKFTEKQDYSDLTDIERAIHRGFLVVGVENVPVTIIKETAQDCLAQMKPAEWSDEDEKMRQRIIRHIESEYQDWCKDKYGNYEIVSDGKESCRERIAWLKSLKNRGNSPKSNTNSLHWKPSGEQVEAIEECLRFYSGSTDTHQHLKSLLNELMKL